MHRVVLGLGCLVLGACFHHTMSWEHPSLPSGSPPAATYVNTLRTHGDAESRAEVALFDAFTWDPRIYSMHEKMWKDRMLSAYSCAQVRQDAVVRFYQQAGRGSLTDGATVKIFSWSPQPHLIRLAPGQVIGTHQSSSDNGVLSETHTVVDMSLPTLVEPAHGVLEAEAVASCRTEQAPPQKLVLQAYVDESLWGTYVH